MDINIYKQVVSLPLGIKIRENGVSLRRLFNPILIAKQQGPNPSS